MDCCGTACSYESAVTMSGNEMRFLQMIFVYGFYTVV